MLKIIMLSDIKKSFTINDFKPWDGAIDTFNTIRKNNELNRLECVLEKFYPNGITITDLNYLLWFEKEWIFKIMKSTDEEVLRIVKEWAEYEDESCNYL